MEIERKFLVKSDFKRMAYKQTKIAQGYLSRVPERTVRIRLKGERGFITIKGEANASGTSRFEWEKEIPFKEAKELIKLCEPAIIEKTRYLVRYEDHVFEVDEFYGENEGLLLAEIELTSEDESFKRPTWLGEEVTGNVQYYNSMLSEKPFSQWEK